MTAADHASDSPLVQPPPSGRSTAKTYLVGGGIASMAAVFMIRDGDIDGRDITILEE